MAVLENTFRVAIFERFFDAFADIPRAQQKKVREFIRRFRLDPTAQSINYEKIGTFADPNLRTVRIDNAYRAIVLKPEKGNVFVLLWVDHHDKAMAWAKNKKVEVHPETGSLQVLTLEDTPPPPPPPATRSEPPVFQSVSDGDLVGLGVPETSLLQVRALRRSQDLEAIKASLPPEAFEALFFLADGESLDEVRRALEIPKENLAPDDFERALETDVSRRSFRLVEDDAELAAILDAPLEKWRVFLHPTQRKLVEKDQSGPVRVLGGAGTGKTVVAMHRAAHLAQKVFAGPDDRLLFTTFTRNLAADIHESLSKICPNDALKRIEVVHLDKWVTDFLNRSGYRYEIEYWDAGAGKLARLWGKAMQLASRDFPESFYREEWEYVVQPEGCTTEEEYVAARRAGRGVRLSRGQRKALWPVFDEYRKYMEEDGLRESVDAMRDAAALLERQNVALPYKAVIVDEAQDMSTTAFHLIRRIIPTERPNDLFIVGDGHQKIYRRPVVLGRAGIRIVGRSYRLRINYRTTEEIRSYAFAFLHGIPVDDLDASPDTGKGYRSLFRGTPPRVVQCRTFEDEVETISKFVGSADEQRACLVARTNEMVDQYAAALEGKGIRIYRVRRATAEDHSKPGLRVATMHRVKGLEFDRMVVAGVNEGVVPLATAFANTEDRAVRADLERQERALLYVSISRARREVLITSSGRPSPWLALSPQP